ncbi:hypothetical protein B0H10DRAFT_2236374 [Mycena sp. CBHHK59/15]|nr:hypothetical protein B0H10DRAFT_2236374 [Mycena sp. CBHHK59/15]
MHPHVRGDPRVKPASLGQVEWEVASLNAVLNEVVQMREDLREGMHIIFWCEWLLELASERAEQALRDRDLAQEQEKKEEALFRLTTRERKLRKRINNINMSNRSNALDRPPFLTQMRSLMETRKGYPPEDAETQPQR